MCAADKANGNITSSQGAATISTPQRACEYNCGGDAIPMKTSVGRLEPCLIVRSAQIGLK